LWRSIRSCLISFSSMPFLNPSDICFFPRVDFLTGLPTVRLFSLSPESFSLIASFLTGFFFIHIFDCSSARLGCRAGFIFFRISSSAAPSRLPSMKIRLSVEMVLGISYGETHLVKLPSCELSNGALSFFGQKRCPLLNFVPLRATVPPETRVLLTVSPHPFLRRDASVFLLRGTLRVDAFYSRAPLGSPYQPPHHSVLYRLVIVPSSSRQGAPVIPIRLASPVAFLPFLDRGFSLSFPL